MCAVLLPAHQWACLTRRLTDWISHGEFFDSLRSFYYEGRPAVQVARLSGRCRSGLCKWVLGFAAAWKFVHDVEVFLCWDRHRRVASSPVP